MICLCYFETFFDILIITSIPDRRVSKHAILTTEAQNAQREQLLVAVVAIQKAKKALSISHAAKQYSISKTTLSN